MEVKNWGGKNGWASNGGQTYRIVPQWVVDMIRETMKEGKEGK